MNQYLLSDQQIISSLNSLAAEYEVIALAVALVGYPQARHRDAGFGTLARIIVGQQVSVKAATSIAAQLESALSGTLSAEQVMRCDDSVLRGAGLSRQKVVYIRALSEAVRSGELDLSSLYDLSDAEAIAAITAVKGFGIWSAHMYLMFSLGRLDIWPVGDLAVRGGFARIIGEANPLTERQVAEAGAVYSPHRSALALLCWKYYSEAPL